MILLKIRLSSEVSENEYTHNEEVATVWVHRVTPNRLKLRKIVATSSRWDHASPSLAIPLSILLRLPHTSQFLVVELQIFRLRFVGTLACRTLAEFLSQLTPLRLGAE